MIRGLQVEVKNDASGNYSVLMLNMHHIAADGWSMGILTLEFSRLYQSLVSEQKVKLPELEIQYADFAAWQRQSCNERVEQETLAYWQQTIGEFTGYPFYSIGQSSA